MATKKIYPWLIPMGQFGVGKTWLMDLFYHCLTLPKQRYHFHHFMHDIHQVLQTRQGHPEPLVLIAQQLAKQTKVVCLDEFLVHDIADAARLTNLLKAMFQAGITLVITYSIC